MTSPGIQDSVQDCYGLDKRQAQLLLLLRYGALGEGNLRRASTWLCRAVNMSRGERVLRHSVQSQEKEKEKENERRHRLHSLQWPAT